MHFKNYINQINNSITTAVNCKTNFTKKQGYENDRIEDKY